MSGVRCQVRPVMGPLSLSLSPLVPRGARVAADAGSGLPAPPRQAGDPAYMGADACDVDNMGWSGGKRSANLTTYETRK